MVPSRIATSRRIDTVAAKVAAATAKSWRLRRHSWRQAARSNSDQAIRSSKAAIAAIGISASSGALTAASSSSQSEANTAASGVRAPASRLGSDRFSEPHETYDENSPPTMFEQALAAKLAVGVDVLARARRDCLGDRDRLAEGDDRQREGDADEVGQDAEDRPPAS